MAADDDAPTCAATAPARLPPPPPPLEPTALRGHDRTPTAGQQLGRQAINFPSHRLTNLLTNRLANLLTY
eukprot:scaffold91353_cov33-Phaeocystis_antarctica.AAC.1